MDYEDRFHASQSNDVEKDKNMIDELKQNSDKRYFKVSKKIDMGNNYHKNIKVEMYGSGDVGSTIRDAESGLYYKGHLVGSHNENLYFKTSYTLTKSQDSLMLYYLSPEHYERHQYIVLSNDIKQKWHQKKSDYVKKNNL